MFSSIAGHAILLVEDEPSFALNIANALERADARVIIGHRLREAQELAESSDWSAAILHHDLSGMNCSSICEQLNARRIPCVIYTRHEDLPSSCNVCVRVRRPVSAEEIVGMVEQLLKAQN